jgi:predicted metal-binding protein
MTNINQFNFLKDLALQLGASEAKIIPTKNIIVENRVVLKCKIGCNNYGKTLMCPPYAPNIDDFRKTLTEYNYALVLKIKSQATATPETAQLLSKNQNDPTLTEDQKQKITQFWNSWNNERKQVLEKLRKIEKAAMNNGYPLALAFTTGTCILCDKCNTEQKICKHPTEARCSAQAVGINIMQTLQNAGIPMTYPFQKNPESFGLVLIS